MLALVRKAGEQIDITLEDGRVIGVRLAGVGGGKEGVLVSAQSLFKFRNYYLACRYGKPSAHLDGTSAWRAFKFACRMTWWSIKYGDKP